ncbi:hypothetical protein IF129_04970 [Streptomyces chumphonensis]|uniref:Uncharacterized protein n=1 Tax=Streptomyces chumphonensis TaxID=1214925 RepID=A0A927IBU2_9ACTN|nr:hypothetical protein [Streptomyces chumphonensis]MBD3930914.1 hypothetical protein [Streptomyces chumphonensis]
MTGGGYARQPDGSVVVALSLAGPGGAQAGRIRVLVRAGNRARALTRLRNLGLRAVYLRGNAEPPTPDEVTAVLHHPDGLVWREAVAADPGFWQPATMLPRPRAAAPAGG